MSVARSVAIIGGGIGGLTAANTLMRVGLSVSLYERFSHFIPTAGAAFGLQPNGQISLKHIGFDHAKNIIHPFHHWVVLNDKGELLTKSNRLGEYEQRFGYSLGGALRAELVAILKEPVEKAGILHYSHKLLKIEQDADGVTLTFDHKNQTKTIRVDMVIGADGIHSTVVDQIFGQTAPPIYVKENIFYGIIDQIDSRQTLDPKLTAANTLIQCFGRGEFLCYRVGHKGHLMWATTYSADSPPSNRIDDEWTQMQNQRELNQYLQQQPSSHPVHQFAAVTNKDRLLHFGLFYRQHRPDTWHKNRICLLGDACHATLPYVGQGANMAIEDALVLASSLEKHQFQMEPAFREYFQKRFQRTKRVVNMAKSMGEFFHSENRFVRKFRDRIIPWLINSDLMIRLAEKEMFEHCPIPLETRK